MAILLPTSMEIPDLFDDSDIANAEVVISDGTSNFEYFSDSFFNGEINASQQADQGPFIVGDQEDYVEFPGSLNLPIEVRFPALPSTAEPEEESILVTRPEQGGEVDLRARGDEDAMVVLRQALAFSEDFANIGDLRLEIVQVKGKCQESKSTGLHLKRGAGIMVNKITVPKNWRRNHCIVICLRRSNPEFASMKVDRICKKHWGEVTDKKFRGQMVRASSCLASFYFYALNGIDGDGGHNGLCVELPDQPIIDIPIKIMCNDSCINSSDFGDLKSSPERARDMDLIFTVFSWNGEIKARRKVKVWPKASIVPRDLNKEVRRESKGAGAKKQKPPKRLKHEPWVADISDLDPYLGLAARQCVSRNIGIKQAIQLFTHQYQLATAQPLLLEPKEEDGEDFQPSQ